MKKNPKLSVLIPSYNHEKYIADCIQSVWQQNFSDCEIIMLDDGSSDNTYNIAKRLADFSNISMKVLTRENRGLNKTLNELINLSSGDILYFLASDDKLSQSVLHTIIDEFNNNKNLKIIYANGRYFQDGPIIGERLYNEKIIKILKDNRQIVLSYLYTNVSNILTQSSVVKKEFIRQLSGFDENISLDDWPYHIKVFQNLSNDDEFKYIDVDLVLYRRHDTNMSRDIHKQIRQITDTVRKYIPPAYQDKLLAKAYYNISIIALYKNPIYGFYLIIKSQYLEFNLLRLISYPKKLFIIPFRFFSNIV